MAMHNPPKAKAPTRKAPVASTRIPMMKGPVNPPISATQKNMPPAAPICFVSISGLSIKMRIIKGMKQEADKPNSNSPRVRKTPEAITIIKMFIVVHKAKKAIIRPLKWAGDRRGTRRTAGIPAAKGMDAAKPASEAESPRVSKIFGSQLEKPWPMAKEKSAMMKRS